MNWRKMELSWESSKNFSKYKCAIMNSNIKTVPKEVNSSLCRFPVQHYMTLHKGVSFIIEVPDTNISKHCTFIPGGMNGSAIENFSCVIYNISLMNCTWQPGRDAPGDTQYFLYWQNPLPGEAMECERYIKDENGRNTGCRFQNVSIEPEKAYFLVNGSSKDGLIQFYDEYIQLYEIEILTPPLNVTANCTRDSAGCIIRWQPPLTSHMKDRDCFQYEISIRNKDDPKEAKKDDPSEEVRNDSYEFQNYNEKKKYILKIRARGKYCSVSSNWGEWSEPIEFGHGKDYFIFVILFLIALGTISVALLQYCLFKRYCSFKSIFSPVPQPREKLNASTDEDIQPKYVNLPNPQHTEEITMVEEMT
ncbi:granulocyte-macrophage colony-stimulating factor receptor subunit alpha-like isoform X2 [Harpia harpyja]|nr:granulocyte-macrophage colony-stimulating factor receptor subunit alpha-like isoform X2 [Harpia harpyja]